MTPTSTLEAVRESVQAAVGPSVAVKAGRAYAGEGIRLDFTRINPPSPFRGKQWRCELAGIMRSLSPWIETGVRGASYWAHLTIPVEAVGDILKKSAAEG